MSFSRVVLSKLDNGGKKILFGGSSQMRFRQVKIFRQALAAEIYKRSVVVAAHVASLGCL